LGACARQELPFDILAARLAEEDGLDPASLIQVFFIIQTACRRALEVADAAVRPFANRGSRLPVRIDRSWLTVTLSETSSGISGMCRYKKKLFAPDNRRHWIADYKTILTKAAENPEISLGRLAHR
jgi:hypothetical protein